MLFSTSSLAALAIIFTNNLINAQSTPAIPDCAKPCVNNLIANLKCNNDPTCICSNTAFISDISCCILPVCSSADIANALAFANGICGLVGVTLPQSAVCASSSASGSSTSSGTTTVSITSASGSGVTAVGGASASSLTGAAASSLSSLQSQASGQLSSAVSATSLSSGASGVIASITSAAASVSSAAASAASAASSAVKPNGAGGLVGDARASWSMAATGVVVAIAVGALGLAL